MAKKSRTWKRSARARKISKSLKAFHAKARRIQEAEPHLTYAEAKARVKESFIGTVRRSEEKHMDRYLQMGPGVFRRIEIGKPAKRIFTYGPDLTYTQLMQAKGNIVYWGLIRRMSNELGLSIAETRQLFSEMKVAMTDTARFFGKRRNYRSRDVAAVIHFTDRYPKIRKRYGI